MINSLCDKFTAHLRLDLNTDNSTGTKSPRISSPSPPPLPPPPPSPTSTSSSANTPYLLNFTLATPSSPSRVPEVTLPLSSLQSAPSPPSPPPSPPPPPPPPPPSPPSPPLTSSSVESSGAHAYTASFMARSAPPWAEQQAGGNAVVSFPVYVLQTRGIIRMSVASKL
eukprot:gene13320-15342_t